MKQDNVWKELEALAEAFEKTTAAEGIGEIDVASAETLLRRTSPIASEEQLSSELFDALPRAFRALIVHPTHTSLEVALNSIGKDTPAMFTEMAVEVFASAEPIARAEVLKRGLQGGASWAALFIAEYLPDRSFAEDLARALRSAGSPDAAVQAADALSAVLILDTKSQAESHEEILKMEFPHKEWVRDEWERRRARCGALNKVRIDHLSQKAQEALERKDYHRVVELLIPHEEELSQAARRKLEIARRKLSDV